MRRVKKAPHSAKLFFLAAAAEGGGGRRRGLILSPPPPQKREYLAASIRKLLLFSEIRKRDFLEKLFPGRRRPLSLLQADRRRRGSKNM